MRLLLITVRSDFGGGPRHVDQLVDELPSDMEIYMAYPSEGKPYGEKWNHAERIKKSFPLPYRKFSIVALFGLRKFIKENDIDIVHSHGNGAGFYSRLLKVLGVNAKIVHTFHGITETYTSKLKKIANLVSGKVFRRCTDCFICVSKGEYNLAQKRGLLVPERTKIVYNGIDEKTSTIVKSKDFNVVTLSRFDYQKNMDVALEIARGLKNENIQFVWVGDGPDFSRLKRIAEEEKLKIDFVGFSNDPFRYLESASVYLSTSRFEGLPYALIEAACVGLPIIATDVVGNNEIVQDGENGFLFKNVDEAQNKIKYFFLDEPSRDRMSINSRQMFLKLFTIEKMIDNLMNVYTFVQKEIK